MSFYTGTQTETLYSMVTPVTTTVSGTSQVLASAGSGAPRAIIPAQFWAYQNIGRSLYIVARGTQTTSASAPTFAMALGFDTTAGTAANSTTTMPATAPTSSITNMGWQFDAFVVASAISSTTTTLQINGKHEIGIVANGTSSTSAPLSNYFNNQLTAYNSEVQSFCELFVTWGTNTAGNSIIVKEFLVFGLN